MVLGASFGYIALPAIFKKTGNAVIGQLKQFFSGLAKGSAYKTSKSVVKSEVKGQVKKLTTKEKEIYTKTYANKKVDKNKYPTINDFIKAQLALKDNKDKVVPVELKLWSSGSNVKKLQKFLGLEVDGKFGESTELAVKKYQKKKGLTQDGVVGPDTWKKIT